MQANRHERDSNGPGLADAHFAAQFLNIEYLNINQISITDNVIVRTVFRGFGRKFLDALVGLAGSAHYRLRA